MKRVLRPYQQLDNLSKIMWKGKQIRLFLFGDYDFLLKVLAFLEPSQSTLVYGALLPKHKTESPQPAAATPSKDTQQNQSRLQKVQTPREGEKICPRFQQCLSRAYVWHGASTRVITLCAHYAGYCQKASYTATAGLPLLIKKFAWHWLKNYTVTLRTIVPLGVRSTSWSPQKKINKKNKNLNPSFSLLKSSQ